jgi:small GTP-binding protein
MCAKMKVSSLIHVAISAFLAMHINAFSSTQLSERTRIIQSKQITSIYSLVSDDEEMLLDEFYDDDQEASYAPNSKELQQPIRRFKRPKKVPLIAVVGRPNVGKSALVNRIAGTQSGGAIVADEEGITRDRTYRTAEFLGETFQIVDTGGLVFDDNDAIFAAEIREQAMIAIEESSGVILVVDGQMGPTSMDEQLATFLRKEVLKKQPVLLAVNKCESDKSGAYLASQFWGMGLGEPFAVSALHGVGTADLLEKMFEDIVAKGSAIKGFGTKVKELQAAQQAMVALDKGELLEGEDETDLFLRKYGIGRSNDDVIKRYEEAMSAFDDEPTTVRIAFGVLALQY